VTIFRIIITQKFRIPISSLTDKRKFVLLTFYAVDVVSFKMILWRQNTCDSIWSNTQ